MVLQNCWLFKELKVDRCISVVGSTSPDIWVGINLVINWVQDCNNYSIGVSLLLSNQAVESKQKFTHDSMTKINFHDSVVTSTLWQHSYHHVGYTSVLLQVHYGEFCINFFKYTVTHNHNSFQY